jgi:hypothetical protein
LPGWLSATLIAMASGIVLLLVFKYTSSQRAIKRARQQIRASLLSVKLFSDNPWVGFRGQAGALVGAVKLLLFAIVPLLVMLVPVTLLWGQLALWYEAQPLHIDEDAVVTIKLNGDAQAPWPKVALEPNDAVEDAFGVRVLSEHEMCWNVRWREEGHQTLVFRIDGEPVTKEVAVGTGLMRVSQRRPSWDWLDVLVHPGEAPLPAGAAVQAIDVQYTPRSSWTSGSGSWVWYWLAVSLVTGFLCRGIFKVNL